MTGIDENSEPTFGVRIREARKIRGISVRELAKRVSYSASHISAIERDIVMPSISVLTAIVTELDIPMESLFATGVKTETPAATVEPTMEIVEAPPPVTPSADEQLLVQREHSRTTIRIQPGVTSQMLLPAEDPNFDFCIYVYEPGSASVADAKLIKHPGRECGLVLEGTLRVQVGANDCLLEEGDSISFSSHEPHRFWNDSNSITRAVWVSLSAL